MSAEQVVDLALELARDLDQVVADVAQVRARALGQALEAEDRLARGLELVALGGDEPVQLADALLEPVAAASGARAAGGASTSPSSASTLVLDRVDHRVVGVGQRVEHAVDEDLLVVRSARRRAPRAGRRAARTSSRRTVTM